MRWDTAARAPPPPSSPSCLTSCFYRTGSEGNSVLRSGYEERLRGLEEGLALRDHTIKQLRDSLVTADFEYNKVRGRDG